MLALFLVPAHAFEATWEVDEPVRWRCTDPAGATLRGGGHLHARLAWDTDTAPDTRLPTTAYYALDGGLDAEVLVWGRARARFSVTDSPSLARVFLRDGHGDGVAVSADEADGPASHPTWSLVIGLVTPLPALPDAWLPASPDPSLGTGDLRTRGTFDDGVLACEWFTVGPISATCLDDADLDAVCEDAGGFEPDGSAPLGDLDGDGVDGTLDCDDTDPAVHPGAAEVPGDGRDGNCDGVEDCWFDADNDGARSAVVDVGGSNQDADCSDAFEASAADLSDCDDSSAAVSPGRAEVPGDGVDGNCDGVEDCYVDLDDDGARGGIVDVGGANSDADCADPTEGAATDPVDCDDTSALVGPCP